MSLLNLLKQYHKMFTALKENGYKLSDREAGKSDLVNELLDYAENHDEKYIERSKVKPEADEFHSLIMISLVMFAVILMIILFI